MSGSREVDQDKEFGEDEVPTARHAVPGAGGRVLEDVVAADLSSDARAERPSKPPWRRAKKH
jgi:hypothetical protein